MNNTVSTQVNNFNHFLIDNNQYENTSNSFYCFPEDIIKLICNNLSLASIGKMAVVNVSINKIITESSLCINKMFIYSCIKDIRQTFSDKNDINKEEIIECELEIDLDEAKKTALTFIDIDKKNYFLSKI